MSQTQLSAFFASGQIVDFILALVAVEAAVLLGYRRWSGGKGVAPGGLLANLAAGSCLLLALRAALAGASWGLVAACLLAGLIAHLVDLVSRWQG